jgi:hypothetical protein
MTYQWGFSRGMVIISDVSLFTTPSYMIINAHRTHAYQCILTLINAYQCSSMLFNAHQNSLNYICVSIAMGPTYQCVSMLIKRMLFNAYQRLSMLINARRTHAHQCISTLINAYQCSSMLFNAHQTNQKTNYGQQL